MSNVTAVPVTKCPPGKTAKMVILTDKELEEKEEQLGNKNTLKRVCSAHIAFHRYLEQAEVENKDYWLYSDEDLCKWLCKF